MSAIVILGAIASIIWIVRKSYRDAFVDIYVAVLLGLPCWCRWPLPGLPDPTFQQAAILPIAAVFVVRGFKGYRFSAMDLLVAFLLTLIGVSEFINAGFADAQNLIFDVTAGGLLPYVLAKAIIEPSGLRVRFLRNIVLSASFVIVLTIYESKFAYNPYRRLLDPFFPGQGDGWVTTFRYGLARVAGPYGHAILAGVVFMFAIRLQSWLDASNHWERNFRRFQIGNFTKSQVLTGWTILGLILTWVRGPQLGTLLAWLFSLIGQGRNPRKRAVLALSSIFVVGIPIAISFYTYASVGRAQAKSDSQETAAYRKELIDKYMDIAFQHSWLGWGRNGWPKVGGMPSIDNYYLLLALQHGTLATTSLFLIIVIQATRLYRNGMRSAPLRPPGSSLSFNLFGLYIGFGFSIATVFMGDTLVPLFFMMVGFTEAYLLAGGDAQNTAGKSRVAVAVRPFRFNRLVS